MKIRFTMKTPDAAIHEISDIVNEEFENSKLEGEDLEYAKEDRELEIKEKLKQFLRHGETLQVQVDLDTGTATIVPWT